MQPVLPFDEPAPPQAAPPAAPATVTLPPPLAAPPAVAFVRHPRARRYILRVLPDGTLRVTVPRWGTKRDARRFVEESHAWVARQRAARAAEAEGDRAWRDGGVVLLDGEAVRVRVVPGEVASMVCVGEARLPLEGEAPADLRPLVERWLRARARVELPPALLSLAERHGLTVTRVSVRNQQSRWGACARRGSITLNWRLLQ
ncbi:MAG: M48 family metallopeptidase, partial [Vicinamibacteria bacterium]